LLWSPSSGGRRHSLFLEGNVAMYSALFLIAVSGSQLAPGQYRAEWYTGGGIPRPHPYHQYFENRLNTPPGGTETPTGSSPLVVPSWAGPAGGSSPVSLV